MKEGQPLKRIIILVCFVLLTIGYGDATKNLEKPASQLAASRSVDNQVETYKDIANIIFFITMSILGILSYRQAKKTVFSPIKTETFKYQLQAFEKVIEHFQDKSEIDLMKDIDMDTIIDINAFELLHDYIDTFMKDDIVLDEKFFEEKKKLSVGGIMSAEFAEEFLQEIGPDTEFSTKEEEETLNDPALKLAQWNAKKYGLVHYTQAYFEASRKIEKFQNSPLLPKELKKLLKDYSSLVHETLSAIGLALEEIGPKMPTAFPTKEKVKNFHPSWLSNIHNDKRPKLEPKANEILEYINQYLGIDNLAAENS